MTKEEEADLVLRAANETKLAAAEEYGILLALTPHGALCLISQLQLAIVHPQNNGVAAEYGAVMVKDLIKQLRDSGFEATAALATLGNRKPQ